MTAPRPPGLSVRLKLTLSYAGFLLLAWSAFMVVLAFVLHYVPDENVVRADSQSFSPSRYDLVDAAVPVVVAGTAVLALVGLVGGWVLAGWMLRPLEAIGAAAAAAARGSLAHRIGLDGPDDELRRLADVFDLMLGRLEQTFEEQRRFTSNASHELRTPNAVMKTMLEVARADPDGRDVNQLIDRMLEMNDRSTATVEALLRLARVDHVDRVDGAGLATVRCDLSQIVQTAVDQLGKAERRDVRLELDLAHVMLDGDPVLLGHLVTNLLINAHRHNLDADGVVWVRTSASQGLPTVAVVNTGAVLDPAMVPTLVEPFVRGIGRVRATGRRTGNGLGLTIVASIARAHEALLTLHARPEGGLVATVAFPQPRSAFAMPTGASPVLTDRIG